MKNFLRIKIAVFVLFCFSQIVNAQMIIGKPSLGFTQACASPSFNTYYVTFTFSEAELGVSNQFILELSDETGSFSNPTTVFSSTTGSVTASPATLSFELPDTASGEAYKIRVKSTDPIALSGNSNGFPAYYKIQDSPFSINNLIETGVYCSGGSYLLTIDNPGDDMNDSPLQYPALTFNWYKETSPTTSVFVASGNSLSVDEPGTYFAETNYGTCTSNSFSNRVTISQATSGTVTTEITSSLGNPFCPSDGATVLSVGAGNGFQWFKDGAEISGATTQTYETNVSGIYSVNIDLGGCSASASIDLRNIDFMSEVDVPEINYVEEGESLVVTVTTDAINPEFEWFYNENTISGEITNSYEATQAGNYSVVVSQTTGCLASVEHIFSVSEQFPNVNNIPNFISPNGDSKNEKWIIPQEYVSGTNTEITIFDYRGNIVFKTDNYQNNWPESTLDFKDVNPVYYYIITTQDQKTKKGSITVIK
ncbi:hypothetical protein APS56_00995 [Pseudalgibacter alginicilyticus]|uniref:Ig-like domain-containing protein n=1 Tax=Pseudalgibacter alginicilyticus TaxID=1736674 RepID=A0A0P0CCV7_9FLAO|nr:gliding motility-associated C-terminal domain-containing protein [Pseudalgibacter alginicilyticus]ALJ03812.1 hypothetical protein APS56_00995 [Pseudalgibacter alginicilyticus]